MRYTESVAARDEIDVVALLRALWRRKWLILLITAVFAVGSVYLALTATPVYSAQAVVAPVDAGDAGPMSSLASQFGGLAGLAGASLPGNRSTQNHMAVLRSRSLVEEFIRRNELLDDLSPPDGAPHSLWYAVKHFREKVLLISEDDKSGTTRVAVNWTDPAVAAQWANGLVALANELIRARALAEAQKNIEYLNKQIAATNVIGIERVMYGLIENETKTLMLANAREEYAFRVVDPAVAPELRSRPKRKLMVLTGTALGALLSVLLVLGYDLMRRVLAAPEESVDGSAGG